MVQPRLYWYSWFSLDYTGIHGSAYTPLVFMVQAGLYGYSWFSLDYPCIDGSAFPGIMVQAGLSW